jgi:hypothetical protein
MTVSTSNGGTPVGSAQTSSLADVIDTVLDKGLVIDAYAGVSVVGIEILTVNARVVVASIDTYLRFAERVGRLQLDSGGAGVPELAEKATGGPGAKVGKAAQAALGSAGDALDRLTDKLTADLAQ